MLDVGGLSGSRGRAEIFGPPTGILAWGPPGAPFEAQPVEGGYRISGKWRFASGCHHARWLGAHMPVAGTRQGAHHAVPEVQRADERHLAHDRPARHRQQRIRREGPVRAAALTPCTATRRRSGGKTGLLYRFTSNQLYSCGFAGVGLGIARGTIDDFLDLPANKVSRGAREADAREQRGAVAAGAVRGALALGARLPAHDVGNRLGACRDDRRTDRARTAR